MWRELRLGLLFQTLLWGTGLAFLQPGSQIGALNAAQARFEAAGRTSTQLYVSPQPTTRTTKPASSLSEKVFLPAFLPPYVSRDTERYQVTDNMWLFEQAQSFVNVSVNIRMTVIQLKSGGLFVHAPVAPTQQCLTLLRELGEVEYIVLPVTAIEHKVYMGPFVSAFPKAKVYAAPGQYTWPVALPTGFRVDGYLTNDFKAPFRDEIDFQGWFYKPFAGSISEVAFFHKASATLLVTDAVIYIDDRPPDILASKGVKLPLWKKMALQACFLGPPNLDTFDLIAKQLIVSPVIKVLVVSRAKGQVRDWIQTISKWPFKRIIPAHFSGPLTAGPSDLLRAYSFLFDDAKAPAAEAKKPAFSFPFFAPPAAAKKPQGVVFPEKDLSILNALDKFVTATGIAD